MKPLVYTGTISYCLYLVHLGVFLVFNSNTGQNLLRSPLGNPVHDMAIVALSFAACYAVATISWYSFETPILKLKEHFKVGKQTRVATDSSDKPLEAVS